MERGTVFFGLHPNQPTLHTFCLVLEHCSKFNMEHYGECRKEQLSKCGLYGSTYAAEEKAVDARTIGHNPERLSLLKHALSTVIQLCKLVSIHLYLCLQPDSYHSFFNISQGNTLLWMAVWHIDKKPGQPSSKAVDQRDADLLHFWHKYRKALVDSSRKVSAQKQLAEAIGHRTHIDHSIELVGKLLFGINAATTNE